MRPINAIINRALNPKNWSINYLPLQLPVCRAWFHAKFRWTNAFVELLFVAHDALECRTLLHDKLLVPLLYSWMNGWLTFSPFGGSVYPFLQSVASHSQNSLIWTESLMVSTSSTFIWLGISLFLLTPEIISLASEQDNVVYSKSSNMGWTLRSATYLRPMYTLRHILLLLLI